MPFRSTAMNIITAAIIFLPVIISCEFFGGSCVILTSILLSYLISPLSANIISVFILAPIIGIYCAIPPVRFLQRIFPTNTTLKTNYGCLTTLTLIGVLNGIIYPMYKILHGIANGQKPPIIGLLTGSIIFITFIILAIYKYATIEQTLEKPYVLYLRRFRSFSDRVVIRSLLESLPLGIPLVVLISNRSNSMDWDPFTVGFSGLKFRNPISAIPLQLRAQDTDWQRDVEKLAKDAYHIILDATHESSSIKEEIDIIEKLNAWKKVTILNEVNNKSIQGIPDNLTLIEYKRSALESLTRISLYLFLSGILTVLILKFPLNFPGIMLWGILIILISSFQKSLDKESKKKIKLKLGTITHQS